MKRITFLLTMFMALTLSATYAQIIEDFETDPPTGWTFYQTEPDDPGFVQTDAQAYTGTYSFFHNDDNIAIESTSWMVSPSHTVAIGDILTFYYMNKFTDLGYGVESGVWISTASNDPITNPGDFTLLYDLLANASEDVWAEYSQVMDAYAGQTVYIAFKYVGDWEDELYIDNFSLKSPPPCIAPTDLMATNFTATTADLSWTDNAGASQWDVELLNISDGDTFTGAPTASGVANPYTASITEGDEYEFYVRADCDVDGTSDWVGPYSFIPLAPVSNDDCVDAAVIVQEADIVDANAATPHAFSIQGATDSGLPSNDASCGFGGGNPNDDVWFSFEALTPNVTITVDNYNFDVVMEVFSGACGALTFVDCTDNSIVSGSEEIMLSGLTVGETYYFRIYQYSSQITLGKNMDVKVWSSDTLSNETFSDEEFSFYPNPVSHVLNLKAKSNIQNITGYNILGKEVFNMKPDALHASIDMSLLNTGVYFVKVTINKATETIRIIKD